MFDDIPDNYKSADRGQRGRRLALHAGRQERAPSAGAAHARSRRPLHHARSARRAAAARTAASSSTSPGSRSSSPTRAEHIKKKLPSMYHQFKQLADIDITKEPMEVGPTTHYIMGGVRVDGDTQMSNVPGPVRRRRSARRACTAPIAWAATRSPTCSCSASAPASTRRKFAKEHGAGAIDDGAGRRGGAARRSRRSSAAPAARARTRCSTTCRSMMQDLVGIVRSEEEMQRALDGLDELQAARRARSASSGNREYNPGWHTALDLHEPADGLRSDHALRRIERKESRGGHFRDDYPGQGPELRQVQHRRRSKGPDGAMQLRARADPRDAGRAEADHRGE